jgi:branched-chain amino acid transport system substrate-binding protein
MLSAERVSRREFLKWAIACAVCAAVAGAGGWFAGRASVPPPPVKEERAKPPKEEITIGFTIPMSGWLAAGHEDVLDAYLLWRDEVNARGGIYVKEYGRRLPVRFIYYDDRSDREWIRKLYEKLIVEDKVDVLGPPHATYMYLAIIPLLEEYRRPLVTSTCTAPEDVWMEYKPRYLFQTPPTEDSVAGSIVGLLNYVRDELKQKIKTVAVPYTAVAFPLAVAKKLEPLLRKEGYEIVFWEEYPADPKDLKPMFTKIKALNPDVIAALCYVGHQIVFIRDALEVNVRPKLFWTFLGALSKVVRETFSPEALEGICAWTYYHPESGIPKAKWFFEEYVKRYRVEPDPTDSNLAYAAFQVIEQAIEKAGTLDPEKIREVLATEEFDCILAGGKVKYGPWPLQRNTKIESWVVQYQRGKMELVWPPKVATAKLAFPYKS